MILTYRILTSILYPFLILFTYLRKFLKKEDPIRFKEKIFISYFNASPKDKSKLIWFHAASIGEFKSIIPVINQLNMNFKNLKFLITTTTFSSGSLSIIELNKIRNAIHRYFPFDVPFLIDKFISLWRPDKIFLVDSEIWPNLILSAEKNKIPIALINARLTTRSFDRWMLFSGVAKKIFKVFNLYLCSNNETKERLEKLNLDNVYFKGNIKLIEPVDEKKIKNVNDDILSKKRFWFAASTHKEENIFCLNTHIKIKEIYKDTITIIAPRHIDRVNEIDNLCKKMNLAVQILNKNETVLNNKEVIIINYFGALKEFFKNAKSVFVGKSMIKKYIHNGGQNPIEAAKLGCKIYHGPYVKNFEEIYKILEKHQISKKIENHSELFNNLLEDLKNPNKQINKVSNPIKKLESETLSGTMRLIENFIK